MKTSSQSQSRAQPSPVLYDAACQRCQLRPASPGTKPWMSVSRSGATLYNDGVDHWLVQVQGVFRSTMKHCSRTPRVQTITM